MAQSVTVSWAWQALGQVSLAGDMLIFPSAQPTPGVYRLSLGGKRPRTVPARSASPVV
jgi:hypothetical protein